jgi:tRNA(Ile)-lysidine synthase
LIDEAVRSAADLFPRGYVALVACSGGPDSVALAVALARHAQSLGIRVAVGHVDHGLRPESAQEAGQVSALALRLGLEFHGVRLEGLETGELGLEAAAREARYHALADLARKANAGIIATAHTRTDQAETVLLRLARGGGPGALGGIRRSRPLGGGLVLVRPFLAVPRAATEAFCAAQGFEVVRDPHNLDARRARSKVRDLLPAVARALNPRLEEALSGAALLAADEDAFLDSHARAALQDARTEGGLRASAVADLPVALARRVLLLAAQGLARPERPHLDRLLRSLPRDFSIDLPGGRAVVRGDVLRFEPHGAFQPLQVTGRGAWRWAGRDFQVGEGAHEVDLDSAPFPWTLRTRAPGDRFQPAGGRQRKLADLQAEAHIPPPRRDRLAVLVDASGRLFWAEGLAEGMAPPRPFHTPMRFRIGPEMDWLGE